jgi:hypothetical protein
MHANPLLDPLSWEHVVERQRQLYLAAMRQDGRGVRTRTMETVQN